MRVNRLWHVSIGFVLSHADMVPLESFNCVAFAMVIRLASDHMAVVIENKSL